MRLQFYTWNVTNLFELAQSSLVGQLLAWNLGPDFLLTLRGPKILRWGKRTRCLMKNDIEAFMRVTRRVREHTYEDLSLYINVDQTRISNDVLPQAKKTDVSVSS